MMMVCYSEYELAVVAVYIPLLCLYFIEVRISLEHSEIIVVEEDGQVEVCAIKDLETVTEVDVTVVTVPGSASGE